MNPPTTASNPSPPATTTPPQQKKKATAPKGPPWSEQETTHLIRAYQEKWYSLKRGLLRSHQWESVAASVASLCGLDNPSKSGVQCRHKMEKLRKRYREELQRPNPSRWLLFPLMDQLERGPLPISSLKPPSPSPSPSEESGDADADEDEDDEEEEEVIVGSGGRRVRCRREEVDGDEAAREMAEVMMRFEEGFLRIEKKRMEIMREFERDLMELEARRAEMAFESRRCLVEVVDRAFRSGKRPRRTTPPKAPQL